MAVLVLAVVAVAVPVVVVLIVVRVIVVEQPAVVVGRHRQLEAEPLDVMVVQGDGLDRTDCGGHSHHHVHLNVAVDQEVTA
jgi:hypothetical protein